MAGEGCHLRKEHDAAASTRRDLPSDRHSAGGAPGGQQGLCLAETGQEPDGGSTQMETPQMQELGLR